ncbi:hypothetical protein OBBRIDRAFT_798034 [Obba rivulosa]|uniref:Uncharacterized protein n=1 Tax=Obba rivulosa TaxID=1052685 RepID=A0A8E2AJX1_9APHY|nr:hypothetical protein OBBRIDRAFT_798034 [Obba rivulosa]
MELDSSQHHTSEYAEKPAIATPSLSMGHLCSEAGPSSATPPYGDIPWEPPSICLVLSTSFGVATGFAAFCVFITWFNRQAATLLMRPLYSVYPRIVASMVMGGISGTISIMPFVVVVIGFHWALKVNIRTSEDASTVSLRDAFRIVLIDARDAARLGIVLGPIMALLMDQPASDAFNAMSGGQLAATFVNLRIFWAWKSVLGRLFLGWEEREVTEKS